MSDVPQSAERLARLEALEREGFKPARWLPEQWDRNPRPIREIAGRLMALKALFLRTVVPEQNLPSDLLSAYMERSGLRAFLTESERGIWDTPRAQAAARHGNHIGWRLENIWALAWVLGHDVDLSVLGGMVGPPQIEPIFQEFTPTFGDGELDVWVQGLTPRSEAELIAKEDLFYCAHNAVRSAQLGRDAVPEGFHPIGDGGTVHERRHVLTWALSAGVPWDETDLST